MQFYDRSCAEKRYYSAAGFAVCAIIAFKVINLSLQLPIQITIARHYYEEIIVRFRSWAGSYYCHD